MSSYDFSGRWSSGSGGHSSQHHSNGAGGLVVRSPLHLNSSMDDQHILTHSADFSPTGSGDHAAFSYGHHKPEHQRAASQLALPTHHHPLYSSMFSPNHSAMHNNHNGEQHHGSELLFLPNTPLNARLFPHHNGNSNDDQHSFNLGSPAGQMTLRHLATSSKHPAPHHHHSSSMPAILQSPANKLHANDYTTFLDAMDQQQHSAPPAPQEQKEQSSSGKSSSAATPSVSARRSRAGSLANAAVPNGEPGSSSRQPIDLSDELGKRTFDDVTTTPAEEAAPAAPATAHPQLPAAVDNNVAAGGTPTKRHRASEADVLDSFGDHPTHSRKSSVGHLVTHSHASPITSPPASNHQLTHALSTPHFASLLGPEMSPSPQNIDSHDQHSQSHHSLHDTTPSMYTTRSLTDPSGSQAAVTTAEINAMLHQHQHIQQQQQQQQGSHGMDMDHSSHLLPPPNNSMLSRGSSERSVPHASPTQHLYLPRQHSTPAQFASPVAVPLYSVPSSHQQPMSMQMQIQRSESVQTAPLPQLHGQQQQLQHSQLQQQQPSSAVAQLPPAAMQATLPQHSLPVDSAGFSAAVHAAIQPNHQPQPSVAPSMVSDATMSTHPYAQQHQSLPPMSSAPPMMQHAAQQLQQAATTTSSTEASSALSSAMAAIQSNASVQNMSALLSMPGAVAVPVPVIVTVPVLAPSSSPDSNSSLAQQTQQLQMQMQPSQQVMSATDMPPPMLQAHMSGMSASVISSQNTAPSVVGSISGHSNITTASAPSDLAAYASRPAQMSASGYSTLPTMPQMAAPPMHPMAAQASLTPQLQHQHSGNSLAMPPPAQTSPMTVAEQLNAINHLNAHNHLQLQINAAQGLPPNTTATPLPPLHPAGMQQQQQAAQASEPSTLVQNVVAAAVQHTQGSSQLSDLSPQQQMQIHHNAAIAAQNQIMADVAAVKQANVNASAAASQASSFDAQQRQLHMQAQAHLAQHQQQQQQQSPMMIQTYQVSPSTMPSHHGTPIAPTYSIQTSPIDYQQQPQMLQFPAPQQQQLGMQQQASHSPAMHHQLHINSPTVLSAPQPQHAVFQPNPHMTDSPLVQRLEASSTNTSSPASTPSMQARRSRLLSTSSGSDHQTSSHQQTNSSGQSQDGAAAGSAAQNNHNAGGAQVSSFMHAEEKPQQQQDYKHGIESDSAAPSQSYGAPPTHHQPGSMSSEEFRQLQASMAAPVSQATATVNGTPAPFQCEDCGKQCSDDVSFRKHKRSHGSRPFQCPQCPKSFVDNSKLKRHLIVHSGVKNHQCTFPGCHRAFALEFNLKSHIRTHTGEKPYACEIPNCNARFAQANNLKAHKRTHKHMQLEQQYNEALEQGTALPTNGSAAGGAAAAADHNPPNSASAPPLMNSEQRSHARRNSITQMNAVQAMPVMQQMPMQHMYNAEHITNHMQQLQFGGQMPPMMAPAIPAVPLAMQQPPPQFQNAVPMQYVPAGPPPMQPMPPQMNEFAAAQAHQQAVARSRAGSTADANMPVMQPMQQMQPMFVQLPPNAAMHPQTMQMLSDANNAAMHQQQQQMPPIYTPVIHQPPLQQQQQSAPPPSLLHHQQSGGTASAVPQDAQAQFAALQHQTAVTAQQLNAQQAQLAHLGQQMQLEQQQQQQQLQQHKQAMQMPPPPPQSEMMSDAMMPMQTSTVYTMPPPSTHQQPHPPPTHIQYQQQPPQH